MAKLSFDEAKELYVILDENLGVFREREMSAKAAEFYSGKSEEFLRKFSNEIPEEYWFQGIEYPSITMYCGSEGFILKNEDPKVQRKLDEVNSIIDKRKFNLLTSE